MYTARIGRQACIARVTDKQMETIYSMVEPGTPIHILPDKGFIAVAGPWSCQIAPVQAPVTIVHQSLPLSS